MLIYARNGIDPDTDQPIGIFCTELDNDRRVVTGIVMPRNNVGGSGIPTIVGYLSNLEEISLRQNRLSGPLSETAMGYLSNLRVLDLSSNMIPGMIPTTIGIMTSLGKFTIHAFFVLVTNPILFSVSHSLISIHNFATTRSLRGAGPPYE